VPPASTLTDTCTIAASPQATGPHAMARFEPEASPSEKADDNSMILKKTGHLALGASYMQLVLSISSKVADLILEDNVLS
jgi:hypothetical protein